MTFVKNDDEKPRMDLLPPVALEEVAKVLTFGAKKYAAHNWIKCPDRQRYTAAALRHLLAHQSGEDDDPETGLSHLAHAGCCILFGLELEARGLGIDTRYTDVLGSLDPVAEPATPDGVDREAYLVGVLEDPYGNKAGDEWIVEDGFELESVAVLDRWWPHLGEWSARSGRRLLWLPDVGGDDG